MTISRNKIPTKEVFENDYNGLRDLSGSIHSKIASDLLRSSTLYQEASTLEDIVLEDFLAIYNEIKNIDLTNKYKNTVVESFLTTRYSDASFPANKRLNIDTQNGDLVLPLVSSTNMEVESITIENDSNGSIGDSILNDGSTDLNSILSTSTSTLFKYDKIATSVDSEGLCLALSFKLKEVSIINAVFVKMFTSDNGVYPEINNVEVSLDGVEWSKINVSYSLNKSDYYLRFYPINAQFIRIRFTQSVFNNIKTLFGYKYQFLIGLREVSFKQDEYSDVGEYISIPFSTGRLINTLTFNSIDSSNNDIKYMVSANGGGRWIDIKHNNQTLQMLDANAGTLDTTDIKDVRVKIIMDKSSSELSTVSAHEYAPYTSSNKYYLKEVPTGTYVSAGKHISFGQEFSLEFYVPRETTSITLFALPFKIANKKDIDLVTSLLVVNSNGQYVAPMNYVVTEDSNRQNSVITFNSPIAAGTNITVGLKPFLYSAPLENKIELPARSLYDDKYEFYITEYVGSTAPTGANTLSGGNILSFDEYDITSDIGRDVTIVEILNNTFKKDAIYEIKYKPCFRINNTIEIDLNEVSVPSLNLSQGSVLRFDYIFNKAFDINLSKYYTPIVSEYSLEIA